MVSLNFQRFFYFFFSILSVGSLAGVLYFSMEHQSPNQPVLGMVTYQAGTAEVFRGFHKIDSREVKRKDRIRLGTSSVMEIVLAVGKMVYPKAGSYLEVSGTEVKDWKIFRGSYLWVESSKLYEKRLNTQGDFEVQELEYLLTEPPSRKISWLDKEQKQIHVDFAWKAMRSNQTSPFLVLKREGDVAYKKIKADLAGLSLPLNKGHYRWYLENAQGDKVSEERNFEVVSYERPQIFSSEVIARGTTDEVFSLRWKLPKDSKFWSLGEHFVEISSTQDFTQLEKKLSVIPEREEVWVEGIEFGKKFWRLRSVWNKREFQSEIKSVHLTQASEFSWRLEEPFAGSFHLSHESIRFFWKPQTWATHYVLEIIKDGKTIVSEKSLTNTFQQPLSQDGTYTWRVSGYRNATPVSVSPDQSFTILPLAKLVLEKPNHEEAIFFWSSPPPVTFSWKKKNPKGNELYKLEISKDPHFVRPVTTRRTSETQITTSVGELDFGVYYWRVLVLDPDAVASFSSATRKLHYKIYPRLTGPEITENPETRGLASAPKIVWKHVSGAKEYEFVLANSFSLSKPWRYQKIQSSFEVDTKKLPKGTYYWAVRAIDVLGRPGDFSIPRKTTLK